MAEGEKIVPPSDARPYPAYQHRKGGDTWVKETEEPKEEKYGAGLQGNIVPKRKKRKRNGNALLAKRQFLQTNMIRGMRKLNRAFILISFLACIFPDSAKCLIVVHDMVVPTAERMFLRAETRGRFFHKGGELVEFFVDGVSVGKTLSGGDGMAFKPFVPKRTRLYRIEARSAQEKGAGCILALERGSAIFLVEAETALLENSIVRRPRLGSHRALEKIEALFPVVILHTGIMGVESTKKWLQKHTFSQNPVILWNGGDGLDDMIVKGMTIEVLVSGRRLAEAATGKTKRIFSFEETEMATEVQSWEEIMDQVVRQNTDKQPSVHQDPMQRMQ